MAPMSKKRFAEMRSRSEEKILDAALELFATKGYTSTSISQIAQKAGISKGLIYNYFDSKKDLLRAIVKAAIKEGNELIKHALDEHSSPTEELEHIVLDSVAHVKANFQYWKLLAALSHQSEAMDSIRDLAEENRKWSIDKCVALFTKLNAPNPVPTALLFGAALDGILLHYLRLKEEYPIEEVAKSLIETFVQNNIYRR